MKTKNTIAVVFFLISIHLISCKKSGNQEDIIVDDEMFEIEMSDIDGHTSQNSLDYLGIYSGILPCADCEGVDFTLELGPGDSYVKKFSYLGKDDNKIHESSGTFSWNNEGNTITLDNEEAPNQYFVGENEIFHLDTNGNRITGDLADLYKLHKQ